MLEFLVKGHEGLAQLALIATFGWAVLVASPAARSAWARVFYALAMAVTGLVGVTGLILMVAEGFTTWAFPWIGLILVLAHGAAGVRSKRDLAANRAGAVWMAALQVVCLVLAYVVMTLKPF
jgi:hypothetical protein